MRREKEILTLNAFDRHDLSKMQGDLRDAVARRMQSYGSAAVLFYREPIRMVRAEGVWMYDAAGQPYLDVYNNVPSVGHSHPEVVEAISRQAGLLNTHTRYLNDVVDNYTEHLLATFPEAINRIVLTCTGSEANDLALRIAQAATGGTGFIVTQCAYHGNTAAVTELSPSSRPGHPVAPHVRLIPAPGSLQGTDANIGESFAAAVENAIADFERSGIRFAGLLVDTIFSSDGVYADPMGFLARAVEVVHAHRGLFIADEVQPGFGRTGRALWGFLRHGTLADIVTMGKPMGNGFPMGGVATRSELLDCFTANMKYFNTFGGNPVAAAAGLAVLEIILRDGLMENARLVGDYLIKGLREIGNRHGRIGEVRGAGLFIGLELVRDRETKEAAPEIATRFIEGLRNRYILVGAAGPFGATVKIRPPLCFTNDHADIFIDACDAVLRELAE